ncbi:type II toxin-antitoxin system prevent-host-death family antitoxin [Methylobacterium sp. 17Sr1-1]|uniref:type II toxin-antitoxin system Phd/YefM family antitoxin n=1 Tax=Methylobacterium sp. 17Sr1-1 TaxID=2202826 RepID=UPI000D6F4322|nr:type II toxin-antitoxin system prevent-host-death family antitoxin [Methylobacterium sp. 17Sr1-1]AWN55911.1 type II toxin-antitoxin system prevent-host-death family antitoxin [Methylobacterium sp. 17Sr1-1]
MRISVAEAEGQLADLVQQAEAGHDVILTQDGRDVARLVPIAVQSAADRERILMAARDAGRARVTPGPSAARSQDFLYDDDGLPA